MDGTAQECQKATTEKGGGFFTPEPVFFFFRSFLCFLVFFFFLPKFLVWATDSTPSRPPSSFSKMGPKAELSWLGSLSPFK